MKNVLKKCINCNKEIYVSEDINICPICSGVLHNHGQYSDNENNSINIDVDFTCFKCECGNTILYGERVCKQCGQEQDVSNVNIDPKVKIRREKFKDVIDLINSTDAFIKNFRRELNKGNLKKVLLEDFISFIQLKIDEIYNLTERKIFKNISFSTDVIEKEETRNKIDEIKIFINDIYSIYEDLLMVGVPYIWENSYIRICNSVKNFLDSNRLVIFSIVADTLGETFNNIDLAQQKLNSASDDIEIFSSILNIKNLETNFNLFEEGNINIPVIILMMLGERSKYNQIDESINALQYRTYKYFRKFLPMKFEYYTSLGQPILFKLSSYKFMSMTAFGENSFFEKIRIVINALEKAKDINFNELMKFINEFKYKYLYALKTTNDVIQDCILTLSYSKNEKMIVRNALKWYKDLSEGVYRDISSLLIACSYIIDKKEIDYEYVFEWMGFSDKLDFIEKKKKLNFHKLTDGVEKILRHSEAHVDFKIDDVNNVIVFRNKVTKEKTIKEITFSYEEFFKLQSKLQETIYSIISGLDLFIANNYNIFENFLIEVDTETSITYGQGIQQCMLPFLGIVDIKQTYDEDSRILTFKGTSIDRKDRELLEKCIACIAPIAMERADTDTIFIELVDDTNKAIGSVEVITKYIKQYFQIDTKYKKYESLLVLMTRKINYVYDYEGIEIIDIFGAKFISAILQWCMDLIKTLNELNDIDINYIKNLKIIKDELKYCIDTINEFMVFADDKRLLEYTKNIINQFINSIDKGIYGKSKNSLKDTLEANAIYQKVCYKIGDVFGALSENEKIVSLLENTINANDITKLKVGRNDLCPCGSGKKYKRCCLNTNPQN